MAVPFHEPHFFDDEEYLSKLENYQSAFRSADGNIPETIVDISPSYIYIHNAIYRLKQIAPHAKLIVMLRNPIDRAISHHNHDIRKWRNVGSFSARCQLEYHQICNGNLQNDRSNLVARGFYASQLENVLRYFSPKQVLVIISERYKANPDSFRSYIRRFIGLPEDNNTVSYPVWNEHRYYEPIAEDDRVFLRGIYDSEVHRLRRLIGDDIPEWSDFSDKKRPLHVIDGANKAIKVI